jgi:hypothetical protein
MMFVGLEAERDFMQQNSESMLWIYCGCEAAQVCLRNGIGYGSGADCATSAVWLPSITATVSST